MIFLQPFAITFVLLMSYVNAMASPIQGTVHVGVDRVLNLVINNKNFAIKSQSVAVAQDLSRVGEGDLIVAEGYYSLASQIVYINSIDWVGLNRLLGHWRTDDWKVIEFKNYTQLYLYNTSLSNVKEFSPTVTESTRHDIQYRVTPGTGNYWSLLLSGDRHVYIGELLLFDKTIALRIYDDSGKFLKQLNLSRVYTE